jgi:FtsP/CotA-like multicopper oxidase with cupredoxin domain
MSKMVGWTAAGLLVVLAVGAWSLRDTRAGAVRVYYIAADEVEWDYGPSGNDGLTGKPFEGLAAMVMTSAPERIGRVYRKALYREYTDSSFTTLKQRPPEWEHLGSLGPLIRASVGDTIRVVFRNNATRPYSMHPHGVFYDKSSEGAPYNDGRTGADDADDAVQPGGTHTYVWSVPERAGPAHDEGSTAFWMYHSHVEEGKDINAGLLGPMIITARGNARPDGTPGDVDRELVVMFGENDEIDSHYYNHNLQAHADSTKVPKSFTFADPYYLVHLRETLNGFSYGNIPGLTMRVGERVRWYVFATSNFEVHAPHWHGQTAVANHMRTDVLSLVTMQMVTANMVPDNPGVWLFHCHVGPHAAAGMSGLFRVESNTVAAGR